MSDVIELIEVHNAIKPKLGVSLVPAQHVPKVWDQVGPLLQKATDMSEGRYDIIDLLQKLLSGEVNLWIVFEPGMKIIAANTTSFTDYPQGKFCSGQFIGGDDHRMLEWKDDMCDMIERWARDNGCQRIEFTGRAGWARQVKPNGYRELYRVYQKDLT